MLQVDEVLSTPLTTTCSTAELVPVKKRGIYLAFVTFFICEFEHEAHTYIR